MKGSKEAYDDALERWSRYERECQLANTHHLRLVPPGEPPHCPNVVFPRESLFEFRAAYVLLRNAVAEFLELDPATMTQGEVIMAMLKRNRDALRAIDSESGD